MNNFLTRLAGQAMGVSVPVVKPNLLPQIADIIKNDDKEIESTVLQPAPETISTRRTETREKVSSGSLLTTESSLDLFKSSKKDLPEPKLNLTNSKDGKASSEISTFNLNKPSISTVTSIKPIKLSQPVAVTKKNYSNISEKKIDDHDAMLSEKPIRNMRAEERQMIDNVLFKPNPQSITIQRPPLFVEKTQVLIREKEITDKEKNVLGTKEQSAEHVINSPAIPTQFKIINQTVAHQQLITALNSRQQQEIENAAPNILVEIGRVEIRTKPPSPILKASARVSSPKLSLQDYLKRREEGIS